MNPKKFFIIGCQRSGTTLLRLILESHSSIICKDEPGCYETLSDNKKLENVMQAAVGKKWVGFKIPRFAEQLNNSTIYDYGTPNVSKPFKNFYQGEPLIFIVRDVRDVICSMIELRADDKSWVQRWGIPITKYWIKSSAEFRTQFKSEIEKANNAIYYDLATCSLFWKYKNISYFKYLELNFPILKIKYEELVKLPKETISSIIKFLELDWEDSLLQHHNRPHSEVDQDGFAVGKTNARNPTGSFHVGRYRNELTEAQINEINSVSGDLMKYFGYSI